MRTAEVVVPSAADASVSLREELLEVSIAENPTTTSRSDELAQGGEARPQAPSSDRGRYHAASRELEAVAAEAREAGASAIGSR